jgi:hypothetical protein
MFNKFNSRKLKTSTQYLVNTKIILSVFVVFESRRSQLESRNRCVFFTDYGTTGYSFERTLHWKFNTILMLHNTKFEKFKPVLERKA